MDQSTFQQIVDVAMASAPEPRFEYDEALVFFTTLRAQLVTAGATDANIVPWLHDCLAPPFVAAADTAQLSGAMRALCDAFGYEMTADPTQVTLKKRER